MNDTLLKNLNLYFLSLETIGLFEKYPKNSNILLELSILEIKDNIASFFYSINKTDLSIDYEAMAIHNITQSISDKSTVYNKTKVYKKLVSLSKEDSNKNFILVYDKKFTLEVLKNANIEIDNLQFLDFKQILSHIFLSNKFLSFNQNIINHNVKLNYLQYFLNLEVEVLNFFKNKIFKSLKFENSVKKSVLLYIIFQYIIDKIKFDSFEDLIKLSDTLVELKFIYFKKEYVKIEDFEDSELIFLINNHIDKNIVYSCKNELKRRGIELDKHLITSGKYAGSYVENIEDIEYLEWFYDNMKHLSEELLQGVKSKIDTLKNSSFSKKEYQVNIIEKKEEIIIIGHIPTNIRDWLKTQPFIELKYNKCFIYINKNNLKRQTVIYERIKNNLNIISIKKQ